MFCFRSRSGSPVWAWLSQSAILLRADATACRRQRREFSGTKRGRPPLAPWRIHTYSSACFSASGKPVSAKLTTHSLGRSMTASRLRRPKARISRSMPPT
jgi:hypothetical protein